MKKYSEAQKRISMRFSKISGLEALKIYSNRFLGVEKEDLLIHLTLVPFRWRWEAKGSGPRI